MTSRSLHNNVSTMRPLFFPKWPKSILIIFVSSELETDWVIFGHFLICPLVTMEAYRTNNSTDMAKNCKISFNWSLYANWNKIFKKKSSNNMLINVSEWHTKLGWKNDNSNNHESYNCIIIFSHHELYWNQCAIAWFDTC